MLTTTLSRTFVGLAVFAVAFLVGRAEVRTAQAR